MVFDPQCLITDRLARAFVGTLVSRIAIGRHLSPFRLQFRLHDASGSATSATGL